jgi:hypothetical protein
MEELSAKEVRVCPAVPLLVYANATLGPTAVVPAQDRRYTCSESDSQSCDTLSLSLSNSNCSSLHLSVISLTPVRLPGREGAELPHLVAGRPSLLRHHPVLSLPYFLLRSPRSLAAEAVRSKHRPDLLDFNALSKENKKENLELAFKVLSIVAVMPRPHPQSHPQPSQPQPKTIATATGTVTTTAMHCGTDTRAGCGGEARHPAASGPERHR